MPAPHSSPPSLRGLLLLVAAYAVFSASFINYFCRTFGISRWLITIHVPIAVGILAASIAIPALLLLRPIRARRSYPAWIVSLIAGIAASALLVLYAVNFASNMWLGSNITHKLVELWASDWWSGGNLISISPGLIAVLVAVIAVVVAAHLALAGVIRLGLEACVGAPSDGPHGRRSRIPALALGLLLAAGYAAYARELSWRTPRSEFLSSDPLLALMRRTIAVQDERTAAQLQRIQQEDAACRAGYAGAVAQPATNVIVIIVDSLRADHLPSYGYTRPTTPFLTELEASGRLRRIEFATSTCAESNCGIISTLASKTLFRQAPGNFKLHNLLGDHGYDSYFILSGNHDWKGLRELYGTEHTLYFDGRDAKRHSRSDDRLIFEGLERVPHAGRPAFFYFHLMSVHLVGAKLPEFKRYEPSAVKNDWDALFAGEYDQATVVNNYDNGVVQADATIRKIFASLDQKGYLENSVVMILSDHGEGLGDRGRNQYGHVTSLYQEFIRIPMFVYDQSPRAYGNLAFATQIDVAPTLADRLGLPVPACWEGTSMFAPAADRTTIHQTSLETPCYALIQNEGGRLYKYMRCFLGRREALYDLTADPGETIDLRESVDPALLNGLREQLDRSRARTFSR